MTFVAAGVEPSWVGQVPVHPLTRHATLEFIERTASSVESRAVIHYANAHAVVLADRHEAFRMALKEASLVFCDGKSLQWASRLLGNPLPERFTPPDWIDELAEICCRRTYRLFFLGGQAGVAEAAADTLRKRHPGLEMYTRDGYFDRTEPSTDLVIAEVNECRPHIVLVGLGMPEQELWTHEHAARLSASVIMTVGGMFDFVSGHKWRAPRWITSLGLEWLTRLISEPRRLASRYLLGNPRFVWIVLRQWMGVGARPHLPPS